MAAAEYKVATEVVLAEAVECIESAELTHKQGNGVRSDSIAFLRSVALNW